MCRQMNRNKGFTLVELLISLALLSIVMVMVVQFMSSTAGANRKAQDNLKAQSVANEVMTNISDCLMQADFVKVVPKNTTYYTLDKSNGNRIESLTDADAVTAPVDLPADCQLVPDNYGNYVSNTPDVERKVIVDFETYQLPGEKKNTIYPLEDDLEADVEARSFRILKQEIADVNTYLYVEPAYIYVEYYGLADDGVTTWDNLYSVIYRFDDDGKIYMYRSPEDSSYTSSTSERFSISKAAVDALSGTKGLLTGYITDFYLSADADGNALLMDSLFDVNGYMFNAANTVKFRNSQVLTVRPQNLYKLYHETSEETP